MFLFILICIFTFLVVLLIVGRKIADAFPNYLKSRQKKFFETTSVYCLSFIHSGKKYLRCCYATCLAKNRFVDTFICQLYYYYYYFFFFFHQIENSIKYLRTFPTIPHLTPGGNVGGMWGIYFLIFF